MRFEHPELLWLLLITLPGLSAFFCWAWFKKRRLILQFVQSRLLAHLTVGVSTGRQKLRMALCVAAASFILFSLARPQWGFDWEEARQRGLDIVVAIDTSRSMLAEDVSPNRLRRAKLAALDLKQLARNDRLGLVAFAGSAFLQCPLSLDDQAFRQSVEALDVNIIPQGGTALSEAIRTAMTAFKDANDNHKVLVLFTDGEDHDGEALTAAQDAAKDGLRIFTIGVGTANGELLRLTDEQGRIDYVKDAAGQVVKSRLNEELLRQISQSANGFHMLLSGANTIDILYKNGLEPLPKSEFGTRRLQRHHERFQWFLGLAIVVLVFEMFFPEQKRVPRSASAPTTQVNPNTNALPLRSVLLLLTLLPALALASPDKGLKAYQAGDYTTAKLEYERALIKDPSNPKLHFNAGAAAFQSRNYPGAREHLHSALVTDDLNLQQQAYYNLGNTLYRVGEHAAEPQSKTQAWEEAVTHYESALKLNPHPDAQYNLDLVRKRLEELKQQQEQDPKQQQDENQENKDDESKPDQKSNSQDDQDKKDDSQQDQNQQDQEQQDQQNQESPQQPSPQQQNQQNQEQENQQNGQSGQKGEEGEQPPPGEATDGNQPQTIQLTPEQARQLLDAQRTEERPMIFTPPQPRKAPARVFKDW